MSHHARRTTTVTSKGQITIPIGVRTRLGIRSGRPIAVEAVGDELHCTLLSQDTHSAHPPMVSMAVRLPMALKAELRARANTEGVSVNRLVQDLLANHVAQAAAGGRQQRGQKR